MPSWPACRETAVRNAFVSTGSCIQLPLLMEGGRDDSIGLAAQAEKFGFPHGADFQFCGISAICVPL